jgi:hypothetical protein
VRGGRYGKVVDVLCHSATENALQFEQAL